MTDWGNKEQPDDTEDEIIELTDIISIGPGYEEKESIELTELVERTDRDSDSDIIPEDLRESEDEPELFFDYKDKYLKYEENKTDFTGVTQEELEAALEKVIEKQYTDKIEGFVLQTVEKVIEKEISELKESLKKDFEKMIGVK